jgi:hypothetical protein
MNNIYFSCSPGLLPGNFIASHQAATYKYGFTNIITLSVSSCSRTNEEETGSCIHSIIRGSFGIGTRCKDFLSQFNLAKFRIGDWIKHLSDYHLIKSKKEKQRLHCRQRIFWAIFKSMGYVTKKGFTNRQLTLKQLYHYSTIN